MVVAASVAAGRLEAVGAIIGVRVRVTEEPIWQLTDDELRVGLGWYAERGHSENEAVALAFLHLWEGPRNARIEAPRARRRQSFSRLRRDAVPLFDAVYRVQSGLEVLAAMPGLRAPLAAAVYRSIPVDVTSWPRQLQWIALVLCVGLVGQADELRVSSEVRQAWDQLVAEAPGTSKIDAKREVPDASGLLRRVMAPGAERSAVQRYERAIAWLLPTYDLLGARDALDRGIDGPGADGDPPDHDSEDAPPTGLEAPGAGTGGDGGAGDDDPEGADDPEGSAESDAPDAGDERARAGDGRETAEGSDLFAAEQAGFVQTMLETPMPGSGTRLDPGAQPQRDREAGNPGDAPALTDGGGPGAAGGAASASLADYRARAVALADAIVRMRAVWAKVVAERVAPRRLPSPRPLPEGAELATDSLAAAVAESLAGVARPRAFRDRAARLRRTRRAGSTDYVLLVDRSASMQGPAADAAADAMLIMSEALAGVTRDIDAAERLGGASLDLDIRTALIVFDSAVEVVKPLSSGLDDAVRLAVHRAVRSPRGSTNDGAALREAAAQLGIVNGENGRVDGRRGVDEQNGLQRRRVVILVSDGGSNDPVAAEHALRRLHRAGVRVHGIGIGAGEIEARYAPLGRTLTDVQTLPEVLYELVVEDFEEVEPGRRLA